MIKMKNLIALFFGLLCMSSFAEEVIVASKFGEDSIQCVRNRSIYREFVKQKNYDDAIQPWSWAYTNCPQSSKNIFVDGAKIFKYRIKKAKSDKTLKIALADSLIALYDARIQFFGQEGYVLGLKGADLLRYFPERLDEAFNCLKTSVETKENKSKATALFSYFKASVAKFENKSISKIEMIEVYAVVADYVDYNLRIDSKSNKYYVQASEKIENLFAPFATCEDLVAMFENKYSETPDDLILLKRIVKNLQEDCKDASLYYSAVSKLHVAEPSAFSAYNMGGLSVKNKKYSDAIKFYKQAIEISSSESDKSKYYLGLANAYFKAGKPSEARKNAYISLEKNPEWGKPLILIGDLYVASATDCSSNAFEAGMVYSAAIDKFIRAKNVDSSVSEIANKKIITYTKYLPTTEDAFFSDSKDGDSFRVGCWINEATKVRIK